MRRLGIPHPHAFSASGLAFSSALLITLSALTLQWLLSPFILLPQPWLLVLSSTDCPDNHGHEGKLIQRFSAISGLEVGIGLAVVNGNQAAYLRLIGILAQTYQQELEYLGRSWESGDLAELGQLAHKIKGFSGNFSAPGIRDLAASLKSSIRQPASLNAVDERYEALVLAISGLCEAVGDILAMMTDG